MACKHEASALQCERVKDKSTERSETVAKSKAKKIAVQHYVEITEETNLDDYHNFFVTNVGGKQYLVELWD